MSFRVQMIRPEGVFPYIGSLFFPRFLSSRLFADPINGAALKTNNPRKSASAKGFPGGIGAKDNAVLIEFVCTRVQKCEIFHDFLLQRPCTTYARALERVDVFCKIGHEITRCRLLGFQTSEQQLLGYAKRNTALLRE